MFNSLIKYSRTSLPLNALLDSSVRSYERRYFSSIDLKYQVPGNREPGSRLVLRGAFLCQVSRWFKYLSYSCGSISTRFSASCSFCFPRFWWIFSRLNRFLAFSDTITENIEAARPEPYENKQIRELLSSWTDLLFKQKEQQNKHWLTEHE